MRRNAPSDDEGATIVTSVDDGMEPGVPDLPDATDGGPRPLATATFDGEPQPDFVANELIVVPADPAALDAFLARYAGVVLDTIETPGGRTRYLVRVETATVDPAGIDAVLSELAFGSGALAVSSDAGLRLLALAARETAAGVDVSVNWLAVGDTVEDGSSEDGFDVMVRSSCSGGTACPRHGTGAALTMAGLADNGFGGAGPAGPVVGRLTTAHTALGAASVMSAASYMQRHDVAVINMSFGGTLSGTWAWWSLDDYADHMRAIAASGVTLVASAGNSDTNIDAGESWSHDPAINYPCEFDGVIRVGALANDSTAKIGYSNYGGFNRASGFYSQGTVDLWAPSNIWTADTSDPGEIRAFGGTSAAAPFASGVIALIRAADPSLPLGDSYRALWDTANGGSSDPDVGAGVWPNARDAVLQILGDVPARMRIEEPTGPYGQHDDIPLRVVLDDLDSPVSEYVVDWGYENHVGTFVSLGSTASGETWDVQLCDGTYEIVAEAIHRGTSANVSDSVVIEVAQPTTPPARCAPSIEIVTPDDGAVFASGATITFEAVIDDDTTEAPIFPLEWREGGPDGWALDRNVLTFDSAGRLGPGVHDIHVQYGDAADTVTIEVLDTDNEAPNVAIGDPVDGQVFRAVDYGYPPIGIEIDLVGLAYDPDEQVFILGDGLVWSYRPARSSAWTEIGTGGEQSVLLPYGGSAEDWEIRLSATDPVEPELVATDVVTVTVEPPQ